MKHLLVVAEEKAVACGKELSRHCRKRNMRRQD
jgi:hypothetical protein